MGSFVSDVFGGISNAVSDVGSAVSDVLSSDLGKAAATAAGIYYGAPLVADALGGSSALANLGATDASLGAAGALNALPAESPFLAGMTAENALSGAGVAGTGISTTGSGLLGSALNWAKANPLPAAALGLSAATALGSKTPTSTTTTTSIDPEVKAAYLRNLLEARATAAGLGEKQFADFTQQYGTAEQQLQNLGLGGAGQKSVNEAARLAMIEAGYTPQQIEAAQINRQNIANVTGGLGSQYMGAYQNPYETQVVQGVLGDIERQRQIAQQANLARASAARAFGGSRQAVAEALTNEDYLRQAANTAAQLRQQGFTTAAQLGQTDAARLLQAQLANQGIDVSLAQANAQLLQQSRLANQAALAQAAGIRQGAIGQLGALGAQQQNLGLAGAQAVMSAEQQRQALAQARLDAARNLALERLNIAQGALSLQPANIGGTQTTPLYRNPTVSGLGGALSGATLGRLIGGDKLGTEYAGYGAGLGGILGLLG